jgi:hypothetical protein
MKRKIVQTIAVVIGLVIVVFWIVIPRLEDYRYKQMQNDLAEKLGVKIEDYPPEEYFPETYFGSVLKPGMDISEVHKFVIGYENVFRCGKHGELYFYFSSEGEKALGFSIHYDDLVKYDEIRGIDESSRPIPLDGCEPGLLEETK